MKPPLAFALAVSIAATALSASSAAQGISVGVPAPSVGATKSVQGKALTGFEKGKVYVLEFWATWCGSCRPAFPHLGALADTFAGKPVEIYSVTHEDPKKVAEFLKVYPMRTNVAIVEDALFERYGAHVLPTTVLIDRNGRVAAITQPDAVTKEVLDALVADRKIDLPVVRNTPLSFDWDKELLASSQGHVLFQFSSSRSGGSRFVPNSAQITADGSTLRNLFVLANEVAYPDLQWDAPIDETTYRVSVKAPDGKDATARKMLAEAVVRMGGFRGEWRDVEREVYVLRTTGPVALKPSTGPSEEGGARQGTIVWPDATSETLAKLLTSFGVGKTVIDETKLTGRYALAIEWTPGSRASLEAALAKLGLSLTKETRSVRTFVVTPAPKSEAVGRLGG